MTPTKLEKIRRLAEDPRGDPATRAIAQAAYRRYAKEEPKPAAPPQWKDTRHPGVKTSAEYDAYRFADIGSWKKSAQGNPMFAITRKGRSYRIVIFQHKKTPTYGWMRSDIFMPDDVVFSGRFPNIGEAHGDAWKALMGL